MWNLLCQYNNINFNLHQYLKEKKKTQTDYPKKKKALGTVATVLVE